MDSISSRCQWIYKDTISGYDSAIFMEGEFPAYTIWLQVWMVPWYAERTYIEESCMFQKIYGVGNVQRPTKWHGICTEKPK